MTIKAIFWALEQKSLKPIEQIVLVRLCDHANENTYNDEEGTYACFPRQQVLAARCNTTRRTIQNVINRLEDMGYLTTEPRFNDEGVQVSNIYKLHVKVKVDQVQKKGNLGDEKYSPPHEKNDKGGRNKFAPGGREIRTGGVSKFVPGGSPNSYLYNQEYNQEVNQRETPPAEVIENQPPPETPEPVPDSRTKFQMFLDWEPDEKTFTAYCASSGVDPRLITEAEKNEFRRHWSGEFVERTQAQWENRFVAALQFNRRKQLGKPQGQELELKPIEVLSDDELDRKNKIESLKITERELRQDLQHLQGLIKSNPNATKTAGRLEQQFNEKRSKLASVNDQLKSLSEDS